MIREYDSSGRVRFEDDVIVLSSPDVLSSRLVHPNAAAHTEVDHKRLTAVEIDRKSTRLNSNHQIISYAAFCLKKKRPSTRTTRSPSIRRCTAVINFSSSP